MIWKGDELIEDQCQRVYSYLIVGFLEREFNRKCHVSSFLSSEFCADTILILSFDFEAVVPKIKGGLICQRQTSEAIDLFLNSFKL